MTHRGMVLLSLGLMVVASAPGCSLERKGLLPVGEHDAEVPPPPPPVDGGGGRDAGGDAGGCAPGTVDADGDPRNGCECMPTTPTTELCDGMDNDCDPATPDGSEDPVVGTACDDEDPGVCLDDVWVCEGRLVCEAGPTEAVEICGDGVDNDCDGAVDEEGAELVTFYADVDGDGYGADADTVEACALPEGYLATGGDCDDTDAAVSPEGVEVCDRRDQDCDGARDEEGCPCPAVVRGGTTYLLCAASTSWTGARDACAALGYHLVKVDDAAENDFLRTSFAGVSGGSAWIGYNDRDSGGDWRWHDGSEGSYSNWADGEPNNGGWLGDEDCAELRSNGEWNDSKCDDSRGYVCEG